MTEQIERPLVLVKPDGFRRGLSGEVLRRIEAKGYTLVALVITTPWRLSGRLPRRARSTGR